MTQSRKSCFVCGKSWMQRNLVSHAHNVSIRRAKPNLRRMKAMIGRSARSIWVCAKCLKAGKVAPAPSRKAIRAQ